MEGAVCFKSKLLSLWTLNCLIVVHNYFLTFKNILFFIPFNVSFLGCIFFLSHFVTSRHILKPCPTKSSRVDSTIKAASIKNEDFIQHLLSRLNLFRNTTEKLREKYVSNFCLFLFLACKVIRFFFILVLL